MPAGLPYLTMPFSGSSSMMPTLFCRSASRSTPRIFIRLPIRLTASPRPLSLMPMSTSRVNVFLFATAQATAWQSRSTRAWSYVSMMASALCARSNTSSSSCCCSSLMPFFASMAAIWDIPRGDVGVGRRRQRVPERSIGTDAEKWAGKIHPRAGTRAARADPFAGGAIDAGDAQDHETTTPPEPADSRAVGCHRSLTRALAPSRGPRRATLSGPCYSESVAPFCAVRR